VRFGKTPRATVHLSDDTEIPIGVAELPDYITETGNPRNRRGVREVVVKHPSPLLGPGIVLADTPGTGSVHAHNTQSAAAFLPRVDVALLVVSVSAPLSEAEARLLTAVGETAARAAVCLNKVDLLSPAELIESLDFVAAQIAALTGGIEMPVFPVSARAAARGDDGGLGALRRYLSDVIVTSASRSSAPVRARSPTASSIWETPPSGWSAPRRPGRLRRPEPHAPPSPQPRRRWRPTPARR
jgi:hypothetical protein